MKQKVIVNLGEHHYNDRLTIDLALLSKHINEMIALGAKTCSIYVEIYDGDLDSEVEFQFHGERDETDFEYKKRIDKEKFLAQQALEKQERLRKQAYEEYLRLKKIFE